MKVTGKNWKSKGEWYDHIFSCPSCEGENIWTWFKFCPDCGTALEIDEDAIYDEAHDCHKKFMEELDRK